jgi:hypothetical protein
MLMRHLRRAHTAITAEAIDHRIVLSTRSPHTRQGVKRELAGQERCVLAFGAVGPGK